MLATTKAVQIQWIRYATGRRPDLNCWVRGWIQKETHQDRSDKIFINDLNFLGAINSDSTSIRHEETIRNRHIMTCSYASHWDLQNLYSISIAEIHTTTTKHKIHSVHSIKKFSKSRHKFLNLRDIWDPFQLLSIGVFTIWFRWRFLLRRKGGGRGRGMNMTGEARPGQCSFTKFWMIHTQ